MLLSSIIYPSATIAWVALVSATPNCPFLGYDLPAPQAPSNSNAVQTAIKNSTSVIQEILQQTPGLNTTSFSLQVFSTHEKKNLVEHHYAAPVGQVGASNIDGSTVYRIGSVSKLLATYLWLIEDGDIHFNNFIADFVPELAKAAESRDGLHPLWEDITVGELASHLAGISRDCKFLASAYEIRLADPCRLNTFGGFTCSPPKSIISTRSPSANP
jgi:CubicO group peptidase (beta-lactamase class C family)